MDSCCPLVVVDQTTKDQSTCDSPVIEIGNGMIRARRTGLHELATRGKTKCVWWSGGRDPGSG